MLSDEEKEAIEILKLYFGDNPTLNITKYVNIVLNLIEKQSKEIEEYKKELDLDNECEIALNNKVMDLEKENEELKVTLEKEKQYRKGLISTSKKVADKLWEDKIKAKIEEVEDGTYDAKIILKSLLEKE